MEIQNPFQIIWENSSNDFAAFFNAKFAKYGSQLAMVIFIFTNKILDFRNKLIKKTQFIKTNLDRS